MSEYNILLQCTSVSGTLTGLSSDIRNSSFTVMVVSGITKLLLMPGPRQLTCSGVGKCIYTHCVCKAHSMPILGGLAPPENFEKLDPLISNLRVILLS